MIKIHCSGLGRMLLTGLLFTSTAASADEALLTKARDLLRQANAKQAFIELSAQQDKLAGNIEFDYLLGVAALDSGRNEDAIIAFERVLILNPNHAGAQLDLARAYYQTGAFELSEAGFLKLKASNPPADALGVINRYLESIAANKRKATAGFSRYIDLGWGHDSNITGVPADFTSAVFNAFALPGIQATGNSVKQSAAYVNAQGGVEYTRPINRGYSLFAGLDGRARAYHKLPDFRILQADVRAGATRNAGDWQSRLSASYQSYRQEGAAPGEPKAKNDRNQLGFALDSRYSWNNRNQFTSGVQYSQIKFPSNTFEDFRQLMVNVGWLRSLDGKGSPMFYVSGFWANDKAQRRLPDGESDKSKRVFGARLYGQISATPTLSIFAQAGVLERRDQSDFARAITVARGRDRLFDTSFGTIWKFQERCTMRAAVTLSRNDSNIAIFDYSRREFSTSIRCEN